MTPTPHHEVSGAIAALVQGRHQQPHDLLGQHLEEGGLRIRVLRPMAGSVRVRFEDGEVTVIAELPKKVEWDQKRLASLAAMIRAEGEDPADYVATEFKVSERAYNAWPSRIRDAFQPARTTKVGKMTIKLELQASEQQRGRP